MSATRARRTFTGADATARAVLAMSTLPPVEAVEPPPAGGITITDSARMQAVSFGMKPYEIADMQRHITEMRQRMGEDGHQFTFRTREVHFTAECGLFTITRVQ